MRRFILRGIATSFILVTIMLVAAYVWRLWASVKEIRPPVSSGEIGLKTIAPISTDWPWWRGATKDNLARQGRPLVEWSTNQGVFWKVEIPGFGHASPVIRGDQIFLFSADETTQEQFLLCLNPKKWFRAFKLEP